MFCKEWDSRNTSCYVCLCVCRILVHLSRGGAEVQMFAPDVTQMHVIDHCKGQPAEKESR